MVRLRKLWLLTCTLFIFLSGISCDQSKTTPIELNLLANWIGVPFAVEVIREEISSFYPLVKKYVEIQEGVQSYISDETIYRELKDFAVSELAFSEAQLANVNMSLSLHRQLAVVEAYYQYFTEIVVPSSSTDDISICENVLVYNDKTTCDSGLVFAFETVSKRSNEPEQILPDDKIFGNNSDAPLAILYADILSESFPAFHSGLLSSAEKGKIRYLLRYKPSTEILPSPNLSGYGVGLNLKRTDYIVIDDRSPESENESSKIKDPKGQFTLRSSEESSSITKADLALLGLRAANFILENNDPYSALKNVSYDFPKYLSSIGELMPHNKTLENLRLNSQNGVPPGTNLVNINGAIINTRQSSNILSMLEVVDRERQFVSTLAHELGINDVMAAKLISANAFKGENEQISTRYDYRTSGLIWLNDIEEDPAYRSFSKEWQDVFSVDQPGMLPKLKRNIFSVVLAIDFTNAEHINLLPVALNLLRNPNLPIQVGLIPLTGVQEANEIAQQFSYLNNIHNKNLCLRFCFQLLNGDDNNKAFNEILSAYNEVQEPDLSAYSSVLQSISTWMENFDISSDESLIFIDGVLVPSTPQWLRLGVPQFGRDLELVEQLVASKEIDEIRIPIKDYFLNEALKGRNKALTNQNHDFHVDIYNLMEEGGIALKDLASFTSTSTSPFYSSYWLIADFSEDYTLAQIKALINFISTQEDVNIRLNFIPTINSTASSIDEMRGLQNYWKIKMLFDKNIEQINELSNNAFITGVNLDDSHAMLPEDYRIALQRVSQIVCESSVSLGSGLNLIVNGRIIEINPKKILTIEDLDYLSEFEKSTRLEPIHKLIDQWKLFKTLSTDEMFMCIETLINKMERLYLEPDSVMEVPINRFSSDMLMGNNSYIELGNADNAIIELIAIIDPLSERGQEVLSYIDTLAKLSYVHTRIIVNPQYGLTEIPLNRFYRFLNPSKPEFDEFGSVKKEITVFDGLPQDTLFTLELITSPSWIVTPAVSAYDLDNIVLNAVTDETLHATYNLEYLLLEGHAFDYKTKEAPRGASLDLGTIRNPYVSDTIVMANLGYFQFKTTPGLWSLNLKNGSSSSVYAIDDIGSIKQLNFTKNQVWINSLNGQTIYPRFSKQKGKESSDVLAPQEEESKWLNFFKSRLSNLMNPQEHPKSAEINIFSVASGHLYERFLSIMTASVMQHTNHTVKFWLIEDFLSPSFKEFLPTLAENYGFDFEYITYKWPHWIRAQSEKQRTIWAYKILFLDVMFPQTLEKVIFVDADQIVRTDLKELMDLDLQGAPYGYTPMCDSRAEMEGFRFWKQGYWKNYLRGNPYHISALYVIDLNVFRQMAAGDRLRESYQALSADPGSLSNLDQDLPNHMQFQIPIFSLPQDWLWCETWCSDEALLTAKTIDLCNNPLTKEPKLDRARRQIPEWVEYDNAIAELRENFQARKNEAVNKNLDLEKTEIEEIKPESDPIEHVDL